MIKSQYQKRIHSLQKHTLALQLFLIAIGGGIFGISVEVRNILRVTKPEFLSTVRGFLELMLISGIIQIVSAGFSCFTACWKLLAPMRIAIVATVFLILTEIAAIVAVFYLMSEGHNMVTEEVYVHWYEWECEHFGSCHNAFANYVNYYMLPQVLILSVAIFLQGLSIVYIGRFMCTLTEKHLRICQSREPLDEFAVYDPTEIMPGGGRPKMRHQRESVDSIDFITDLLRQRKTSMSDVSGGGDSAATTEGADCRSPIPITPCTNIKEANTHTQAEIHQFEIDDSVSVYGKQEKEKRVSFLS